jgi:hypothetical protein
VKVQHFLFFRNILVLLQRNMIAITILSISSSANQTMEKAIQSSNETGQDVKQTNKQFDKIGSKITEGAFSRLWFL